MNAIKKISLLSLVLLLNIFVGKNLYASDHAMVVKNQMDAQCHMRSKNLADVNFIGKSEIENIIDELTYLAKDPYAASLPLIASAEIGDKTRYQIALVNMLKTLDQLDNTAESTSTWMQNNSFKAWMWGRILLSADSIDDAETMITARKKLEALLKKDFTDNDNFAFFTWAWGYRAAFNQKEYVLSKKRMLTDAMKLTEKYKTSGEHGALSDALWAWVMNLQAAANASDYQSYRWIKEQIKWIAEEKSVTQALEKGLLRTAESNDYPAWAMAKTRYAAIVMNDKALYQEIEQALISSIDGAQKSNAKAEFTLSTLDNQLAILTASRHY